MFAPEGTDAELPATVVDLNDEPPHYYLQEESRCGKYRQRNRTDSERSEETEEQYRKNENKRERNREAARKCRERKDNKAKELEAQVEQQNAEAKKKEEEIKQLLSEIRKLEECLQNHTCRMNNNNCSVSNNNVAPPALDTPTDENEQSYRFLREALASEQQQPGVVNPSLDIVIPPPGSGSHQALLPPYYAGELNTPEVDRDMFIFE